jgi:hypothetical protein
MLGRNSAQSKFRPAPGLDEAWLSAPKDQGPNHDGFQRPSHDGSHGSPEEPDDLKLKQKDSQVSSKDQISLGEWSKEGEA